MLALRRDAKRLCQYHPSTLRNASSMGFCVAAAVQRSEVPVRTLEAQRDPLKHEALVMPVDMLRQGCHYRLCDILQMLRESPGIRCPTTGSQQITGWPLASGLVTLAR